MATSNINHHQELMTITAEECAELAQVCSKGMRKYNDRSEIDDKWRDKLIEEAGDVYTMLEMLVEFGYLRWIDIQERVVVKRKKLAEWTNLLSEKVPPERSL